LACDLYMSNVSVVIPEPREEVGEWEKEATRRRESVERAMKVKRGMVVEVGSGECRRLFVGERSLRLLIALCCAVGRRKGEGRRVLEMRTSFVVNAIDIEGWHVDNNTRGNKHIQAAASCETASFGWWWHCIAATVDNNYAWNCY
jgi:hypothetical protein